MLTADEVITRIRARQEYLDNRTNEGHGHVVPRADGNRTRCGGPRTCKVCALEADTYGLPSGAMGVLLTEIDRLRGAEAVHQRDLALIADRQIRDRGRDARLRELADRWHGEGWYEFSDALSAAMGGQQ